MASTEPVSDAVAGYAAQEIDDPAFLAREGFDLVVMLEDIAYAIQRRADRIGETGLSDRVANHFHHVAASARHLSAYADDQVGFNIVLGR